MLNDELQNFFAVDADTIRAEGQDERIRLVGFDAPETRKPWKGQNTQPAADLATEETRSALEQGATIIPVSGRDATGTRSMGRMIRADGEEHSEYMIRNGLASPTQWSTQEEMDQELAGFFRRNALPEMMTADEQALAVRRDEALSIPAEFDLAGNIRSGGMPGGTVKRSWDRGVDNMQAMLYAFGNAVSDQLGAEGWADDMRVGMERNVMEAAINPAKVASWDDVTWSNVGTYALEAIFENLLNMGVSLGAGLAAVASGGTSVAPTVAVMGAARAAAGKAAMRFALGSGAASYGLNSGEVQKELLEAGIDASGTALVAGIPMAALDAIGMTVIAAPLFKTASKTAALQILEASGAKLWKEAAKGLGKGLATGAATEAPTEALQEIILLTARAYEDPTFEIFSEENIKRVREAAIKGGIAGAATSGAITSGVDSYHHLGNKGMAEAAGVKPDMTEQQAADALQQWQERQTTGTQTTTTTTTTTTGEQATRETTEDETYQQAYPQDNVRPVADYRTAEGWDEAAFGERSTRMNKYRVAATGMHRKFAERGSATEGERVALHAARTQAISEARNALNYIRQFSPTETKETRTLVDIIRQQEERIAAEAELFGPVDQNRRLTELTANRASRDGSSSESVHTQIMEAIPEATVEELEQFIANQKAREKRYNGEARASIRAEIAEAERYLQAQRGEDTPTGDQDWDDFVEQSRQAHRAASEDSALSPERVEPTSSITPPTTTTETPDGQKMQGPGRQEAPDVTEAPSAEDQARALLQEAEARKEQANLTEIARQTGLTEDQVWNLVGTTSEATRAPRPSTTENQAAEASLQTGVPAPGGMGQETEDVAPGQGLGVAPAAEGERAAPVLPPAETNAPVPEARRDDGASGAPSVPPSAEKVTNAETQGVAPPATTENREPGVQAAAPGATATNESQEQAAEASEPMVRPAGAEETGGDLAPSRLEQLAEIVALGSKAVAGQGLLSPSGAAKKLSSEQKQQVKKAYGETNFIRAWQALQAEHAAQALGTENRAPDGGQPVADPAERVDEQRQPEGAPSAQRESPVRRIKELQGRLEAAREKLGQRWAPIEAQMTEKLQAGREPIEVMEEALAEARQAWREGQAPSAETETQAPSADHQESSNDAASTTIEGDLPTTLDSLAELARSGRIEDPSALIEVLSQDLEAAFREYMIDPKSAGAVTRLLEAARNAGYARAGLEPPMATNARTLQVQTPKRQDAAQPPSLEEAPTAAAGADSLAAEIEGFEATFEELLREHQDTEAAVLENEAHAAQDETFEERLSRERAEIERAYLEGTYPPKPVSLVVNVKPDGVKADGLMADAGVVVLIGRLLQTVTAEAGLKVQVSLARGAERQTVALDDFTWDLVNKDGWSMIDVRLEGLVEPDQTVLSENPQQALERLAEIFTSGANSPKNKAMLPVGDIPGINHTQVAVNTVGIRRLGRQLRSDQHVLADETVEQAYLRDFFEGLTTLTELLGTSFKGVLSGDLVIEQKDGATTTLRDLLTNLNDQAALYQSYVDAQRAASEALDDYLYHAGALKAEVQALWAEIEAAQQGAKLPAQAWRELTQLEQARVALEAQREQMVQEKRGKEYAARMQALSDRAADIYQGRVLDGPTRGRLKKLHAKRRALRDQIRPHQDRSKMHNDLARELRTELQKRGMLPAEVIEDLDSRNVARSADRERVSLDEWRSADAALRTAETQLTQAREALAGAPRREAVQAKRAVTQAERQVNAARQALRDLAVRERSYRELRDMEGRLAEREDQAIDRSLERGTYEPGLETEERQARRSANEGQPQAKGAERKARERRAEVVVEPVLEGGTYARGSTLANRVSLIVAQVLRATGLQQDTLTDTEVTTTEQAGIPDMLEAFKELGGRLNDAIEAINAALADPQTPKAEKARLKRMLAEREQDLAEARQTYKLLRDSQGMENPARVIYNNGYATPALRQPIIVINDRLRRGKVVEAVHSIAHEIGHIVQQVYLDRMSPEVRAALARAFQADRPFDGAVDEVLRSEEFAEWFAEQTVAYAAREVPNHEAGIVDFFQRLVRALRSVWMALRRETQLNETFRQFLDAVNGYYAADGEYRGTRLQNQVAESLAQSGRSPFLAQRAEGQAPFANMSTEELPGQHDLNFLQRRRLDRVREAVNTALEDWNGSPTKASVVDFGGWLSRNTFQTLASWFDARGPIMKAMGAHFYRRTDARSNNLGRGAPWETANRQDFAHVWNELLEPALSPLRRDPSLVNTLLESDPGLERSPLYDAVQQALIRETPLNSIPDPETRAAVKGLREGLEKTRQFLNAEYGLDIQKRADYWPVVVDMVRFQRDKDAIIQKLRTELGMSWSEATDVWEDTVNSDGSILELLNGQIVSETSRIVTPGFEWGRARRWSPDIHRVLRDWQVDDIGGTLHRYATAAVKRGVTQKMFGAEVEIHKRDGTVERRMDPISKLNVALARARHSGELSEAEFKFAAEKAVPALFGQLGLDGNQGWRTLSSWAVTYQNVRLLGFTLFSSLVDPALILNRSDVRSTWNGLRAMIQAGGIKDAKAELKALGALRLDMTEAIVNDQLGGMYMGGAPQRINEAFFRVIQMHRWTNMTRVMALHAGKSFLVDHARGAQNSEVSRQRLRVLGVTPEQVMAWEAAGKPVGDRGHTAVNAALNQFIDDSVLRPNAPLRAAWASDPRMMMFAHLKGFAWSFYERALRQVWTESVRRWGDEVGPRKALALMPAVTLAVPALALALLGYELRRELGWWGKVPPHMDKDGVDLLWELSQRAGFYGPLQFMMDAERAADQGNRVWLLSLLGPQVDQIQDILNNGFENADKSFWRAIPGGLQQMPAARQWFDREVW